jgi:hypothetical protein
LLNAGIDLTDHNRNRAILRFCCHPKTLTPGFVDLIADVLHESSLLPSFYSYRGHELDVTEIHKIMLTMNENYHKQNLSTRVREWENFFDLGFPPRALRFFLWPSGKVNPAELDAGIRHRISWTMGQDPRKKVDNMQGIELLSAIYLEYPQLSELCYDEDVNFCLGYCIYLSPLFAYLCGAWQATNVLEKRWSWSQFIFKRRGWIAASLHKALRYWLYFVAHRWPDLSLEIYGREIVEPFVLEHSGKYLFGEQRLGRPVSESWRKEDSSTNVAHPPRLAGLTYGSHIDDWSIEWDFEEERFAGEFWAMISSQEAYMTCLGMPGAWPADMEFF